MEKLTENYRIHCNKPKFLDWSTGPNVKFGSHKISKELRGYNEKEVIFRQNDIGVILTRQTPFWRPVLAPSTNMVRTAFGMEYIIPLPTIAAIKEAREDPSQWTPRLSADGIEDSRSRLGDNYQRLSVFLQLANRRDGSQNSSTAGSRTQADSEKLLTQNTIIVFDSINHTGMTDELISGYEGWQDLATESSISPTADSNSLAVLTLRLLFDAIANKWSEYIFRMDGFVSALAEDIYSEPANDEPSSALWSISKQLLQAESLLKSHIRLLERLQSEMANATRPNALSADWLRQELDDFKRLGGEVEETLQKPIAHMLDLVSNPYGTANMIKGLTFATHRCTNQ